MVTALNIKIKDEVYETIIKEAQPPLYFPKILFPSSLRDKLPKTEQGLQKIYLFTTSLHESPSPTRIITAFNVAADTIKNSFLLRSIATAIARGRNNFDSNLQAARDLYQSHVKIIENSYLPYVVGAASIPVLAALPVSSLTPILAMMGVLSGVNIAAHNLLGMVDEKNSDRVKKPFKLIHNITKKLLTALIESKIAVVIASCIGVILPISSIMGTILTAFIALTITKVIMNVVEHIEKLFLNRTERTLLYDSALKTQEKLKKEKKAYLKNSNLAPEQKEKLNIEIKEIKGKIQELRGIEADIKNLQKQLQDPKVDKMQKIFLERRLQEVLKVEQAYQDTSISNTVATGLMPDFLAILIDSISPNTLLTKTLTGMVDALLNSNEVVNIISCIELIKSKVIVIASGMLKAPVLENLGQVINLKPAEAPYIVGAKLIKVCIGRKIKETVTNLSNGVIDLVADKISPEVEITPVTEKNIAEIVFGTPIASKAL